MLFSLTGSKKRKKLDLKALSVRNINASEALLEVNTKK